METRFTAVHVEHFVRVTFALFARSFASHCCDNGQESCTKQRSHDTAGTKSIFGLLIHTIPRTRANCFNWSQPVGQTYGTVSGTSLTRPWSPPRTMMTFPNPLRWTAKQNDERGRIEYGRRRAPLFYSRTLSKDLFSLILPWLGSLGDEPELVGSAQRKLLILNGSKICLDILKELTRHSSDVWRSIDLVTAAILEASLVFKSMGFQIN